MSDKHRWDNAVCWRMAQDLRKAIKARDWKLVVAVAAVGEGMALGYQQAQDGKQRQQRRRGAGDLIRRKSRPSPRPPGN